MIDYKTKLTTHRESNAYSSLEVSIESDRGRILSAPAFRRLQKRTQVFALELNASIRSRLTHSLEVGQTARYIAKTILANLHEKKEEYGLEGLDNAFISTAEMTSLLHDIGNPPFGHFAEQTINRWIEVNIVPLFEQFETATDEAKNLHENLTRDIVNYDGNAQAIRVISKLQRLNLTYTQTLSVLKYTRGAYEPKPSKDEALSYLQKKPGFYYSEKEYIDKLQETLGVQSGHRFPITYIMEAADDISYLTADLEDSVEKGILTLHEVYKLIKNECEKSDETYLFSIIEKQYQKAIKDEEPYQFNMFFTLFRAQLVSALVKYVSDIYNQNHEAIFEGSFNSALLEYDKESQYFKAVEILQKVSTKHIYQHKDVQKLELQGYSIINGLLDTYKPLLELDYKDFDKLIKGERIECFIAMRLVKRLSAKQIAAYKQDVENLDDNKEMLELYYRVRLVIDYISGMTDDFALHEYQELKAIK